MFAALTNCGHGRPRGQEVNGASGRRKGKEWEEERMRRGRRGGEEEGRKGRRENKMKERVEGKRREEIG